MIRQAKSDTFSVANYFIEKGKQYGGINIMRLQKLLYYAHGWFLANHDQPLIDECIEACTFGPILRSVYHNLWQRGYVPIKNLLYYIDNHGLPKNPPGIRDKALQRFLDKIWDVHDQCTTDYLLDAAKAKDTPWDIVARQYDYNPPRSKNIPDEIIREHFLIELEKMKEEKNELAKT